MGDKDKYRSAALMNFTAFRAAYGYTGNFWRHGNSFDMIIDYFDLIDKDSAPVFAEYALDAFKKDDGYWYDDFEWWAIAGLRASARRDLFGDHAATFRTMARQCWDFVQSGKIDGFKVICADHKPMRGAGQVWETAKNGPTPGDFASLEPREPGGVWNCDWFAKAGDPCYCVPIKGLAKDGLAGFQNTVTNALHLILAARLAAEGQTDGAYKAAKDQYTFLNKWMTFAADDYGLLRRLADNAAFVGERVGRYEHGAESYAYLSDLAWAGDQGLMLAGLADYARVTPDRDVQAYVQLVTAKIILGTDSYLKGSDGLLLPWRNPQDLDPDGHEKPPGGDGDNYMTGPGVYMRSLLYAYRTNAAVKALVGGEVCQAFLRRNGDAACRMPDKDEPYDTQLTTLTNRIATLTAAYAMLKD